MSLTDYQSSVIASLLERVPVESTEDSDAVLFLGQIIQTVGIHEETIKRLRKDNDSLKRKMAFIENRSRSRIHGIVDVFLDSGDES